MKHQFFNPEAPVFNAVFNAQAPVFAQGPVFKSVFNSEAPVFDDGDNINLHGGVIVQLMPDPIVEEVDLSGNSSSANPFQSTD